MCVLNEKRCKRRLFFCRKRFSKFKNNIIYIIVTFSLLLILRIIIFFGPIISSNKEQIIN